MLDNKVTTFSKKEKIEFRSFLGRLKNNGQKNISGIVSSKEIIKSIQRFSHLGVQIEWEEKSDLSKLYSLSEDAMAPPDFLKNHKTIEQAILSAPDYFNFLSKRLNENHYSDFIASTIRFDFKNGFNKRLLKAICKMCDMDIPKNARFKVYRELSLKNFGIDSLMRIDIFIDFGEHGALIIENKTKSHEHDSQTVLYYESVKERIPEDRIYGLYLSVTGESAECENFCSCSYHEFYKTIIFELAQEPFLPGEMELVAPFIKELKQSIMSKWIEIIEKSKQYRSKR